MEVIKKIFDFYNAYIRTPLDIIVLATTLYLTYEILVKTQAMQLVKGMISLLVLYAFAFLLNLQTMLWLLNALAPGVLIGLALVFQPELRKFFFKLGQNSWLRRSDNARYIDIDAVLTAAQILSDNRRGMLIVFLRQQNLKEIVETGTKINADLSSALLVTIFGHNTPLHDGAAIVQNGKIVSAGCLLPLSNQQNIQKSFGTRHRAALGISEESDAVTLIVSEESGAISLAYSSKLYYDVTVEIATQILEKHLGIKKEKPQYE